MLDTMLVWFFAIEGIFVRDELDAERCPDLSASAPIQSPAPVQILQYLFLSLLTLISKPG